MGDVNSDQSSQQIFDPYSFTHVIHGALFYGLTHAVMGPASLGARAAVALALESAWEVYENTDTVINRYRAATIALGYYGDSVTNSVADILACLLGFVLTRRLAWWWTVSWVVGDGDRAGCRRSRQSHAEHHHVDLPDRGDQTWQLGA